MLKALGPVLVGATFAMAAACSSDSAGPGATAGAAGMAASGAGSSGAPTATGGAGASAGGTGGASGAGTSGSANAGAPAVAGAAGAGGTAGTAGSAGAGGQGGGPHTPVKSAGCGKQNPVKGMRMITTGGQSALFNVNLPANYEANTPMPLGFGFHGFNNGACGPTTGECRGFAMLPAVTVYMKSISAGWEQSAVLEQNITFYQDVLKLMKAEYCIDESRVFVAGVSSGGQFVENLTCRFGDTLWQVTPVSASVAAKTNCKGTPPVLVIHGVTDMAGNYGQGVAEMFAERNGCSASLPAGLAKAKTDMMAAFNAKKAEHVCLDWDGCTKNPVQFCISSQITYDGLTHGWPMIGGTLISDFQKKLPQ